MAMSKRRIQILQGDLDKDAIEWLNAQQNMSASIRLLIYQASRGSKEDYVMECAKQSLGVFGNRPAGHEPQVESSEVQPAITEIDEIDEPLVEDDLDDVSYIEETQNDEVIEVDEDVVVSDVIEELDEADDATEVDWEKEEELKQQRISRMMQDMGRGRN